MAGFEPARAYSAQRILSPLRLPFRHIGIFGHFTLVIGQTKAFPKPPLPPATWQILGKCQHGFGPAGNLYTPCLSSALEANRRNSR